MKLPGLAAGLLAAVTPCAAQEQGFRNALATSPVLLLTGVALIAAAGTLLVVAFVLKRMASSGRRQPAAIPLPLSVDVPDEPAHSARPARQAAATASLPEEESADQEETWEEQDRTADLARTMHRGIGEMELAFRLGARDAAPGLGQDIRRLCTPGSSTAQRVKTAQRLGIGRGEVDLALRLGRTAEAPLATEERS